ncbi:substrate-binding domain-containing protein [Motiliproteus sp. MSK22-1]|uniref:substrate-binding domain-containing protein n=1 Tax=Motiliproteus sp. MSK22-1 TaxID=1897630 RepID=UPI0009779121|nr:substrate-binding domain-containing protein [Motiliproteus sp. MSK22-1]OMH33851.1 sulfate transporter [Motiliproteus sp. MSK22-1]
MRFFSIVGLIVSLGFAVAVNLAHGAETFITLASTTSTQNSGLFDHILPRFMAESGIEVRVVAVGTGQAIRIARNGDADVLLVHHRPSEEKFVEARYGIDRKDVMYNDFVIVGPIADPAGIRGMSDAALALSKIVSASAVFVSRGDDSGTHKKELGLWVAADIEPTVNSGERYRETGSGMGATLNTASAMSAYTLVDRGTWLSFRNKRDLAVMVEGDARLFNPYGVILVNPALHSHIKAEAGRRFIDWLTSTTGQDAIASFRIGDKPLFYPTTR